MKKLSLILIFVFVFSMSSCFKDNKNETEKKEKDILVSINKNEETVEETEEKIEEEKALTDEEKAINIINLYVQAAKKLDFETMGKYIKDSKTLPILESYRQAYSKYSISDERIKELCKARLGTYEITPASAVKNGTDISVNATIAMVNMESLQNKWMEELCNKYPEYTTLTESEMTPEIVDVLIQTMIDVLKDAKPGVEIQKEFVIKSVSGQWVINANNEDFFPSN